MNITSQIIQQKHEIQEIVCQMHKREIIAIDLDTSEKGQIQYVCGNCLLEKMNDNKISTIEQTKDIIQSLKTQRQENKTKEIEMRLDYFKKILDQIMEYKYNAKNILDKIYSQVKAQIVAIQKEKQQFQEYFKIQHNFQEDIKSLSEFISTDTQKNYMKYQQDSQFIDEIFKQFELLFNNAVYFQTIDTFKDAKQKNKEMNENIKIELLPLRNKNTQKTPSLSKLCMTHNKEIIMIDMDTNNKKIEDRFVCVNCISDHPKCQYKTIEQVNQQWNYTKTQQDRILKDLKLKRQEKQEKLNYQIALMRKNYNQQLNEISEKLITEFSLPITKIGEIKFQQSSLQQLSNEELLSNINYLIQYDKENLIQDSKIEYLKSKDSLLFKEIENRLENLKQHDQLDLQESINILQNISNDNQIQGVILLSNQIQESKQVNEKEMIISQELEEFMHSSKQIYCQRGLFNQTICNFKEHLIKINSIKNQMKSIQNNQNLINLQKQVQDYIDKFDKDFKNFKKFCEIEKLEITLETLQQDYVKLQCENVEIMDSIENNYKIKIQTQNQIIDELNGVVKDIESKLKNQKDKQKLVDEKLKEAQNNNTQCQQKQSEQQIMHQNQIQLLNQELSEKENQMKALQQELKIIQIYLIIIYYQIIQRISFHF